MPSISRKIVVTFDTDEAIEAAEIYVMSRYGASSSDREMEDTGSGINITTSVPYMAFSDGAIKMLGEQLKGFSVSDGAVEVHSVNRSDFEVSITFEDEDSDGRINRGGY